MLSHTGSRKLGASVLQMIVKRNIVAVCMLMVLAIEGGVLVVEVPVAAMVALSENNAMHWEGLKTSVRFGDAGGVKIMKDWDRWREEH